MPTMFIPKKLKIGFQKRSDTYTGKLAYIIYYDEKGKLRKEGSWNSWCDKSIETFELDNLPQAGFILNKGLQRDGHWGSGRSVIRVYDSRDFEFEISVENLIGILMHSDVSKRDIVEECVFAWSGTELVLLPVNSEDYQKSVQFTKKQDEKISAKDFVPGYIYQPKKSDAPLTYIGYFNWFDWVNGYEKNGKISTKYDRNSHNHEYVYCHTNKGKKHIFYDGSNFIPKTAPDFSSVIQNTVVDNFAHLVDLFFATKHSQKIIGMKGVSSLTKPVNYGYHSNSLYFIDNDQLIKVNYEFDTKYDYQNYKHSYKVKLKCTSSATSYPESIKLNYESEHNTTSMLELKRKFNAHFDKTVKQDDLDNYKKEIEAWLNEQNTFNSYVYILENNKEVDNSHY